MQINEIKLGDRTSFGLDEVTMARLDRMVLIAGKNGSGKSRLLENIQLAISEKPTLAIRNEQTQLKKSLVEQKVSLARYLEDLQLAKEQDENTRELIREHEKRLIDIENELVSVNSTLNWDLVETSSYSNSYDCVNFVPKELNLTDSYSLTKSQLIFNAKQLDRIGIDATSGSTFAKIQHVQDQWFNVTHPKSSTDKVDKDKIISNYARLVDNIQTFLDSTLDRDVDGGATLFGFPLGETLLSDGQKVLLQFCLALYSQGSKLSDLIIFMDEPENHLHPSALIEVIDKIFNAVPNGQLWVATHSINLLAHYDPKYIWYVEKGSIKYSGNLPQRVLDGLLGSEDEIERLSNFLSLPAQMATTKFAIECLLDPEVVSTGSSDPQTNQIIESIGALKKEGRKLRVLDFGAGKGRLLATISELAQPEELNVSDWLDYYAFDLPSPNGNDCVEVLKQAYSDGGSRYFVNDKTLVENLKGEPFDMIVMCNVFHEIDPKEWLVFFSELELIRATLSNDGVLLIVEDQLLPVGEKAYQNGFLVFDKIQFKKLFKISGDYTVKDARDDGRLRAHFLPANALSQIDSSSRIQAIQSLQQSAKSEIKSLRSKKPTYHNGKLHGFWIQQLANAQLALDEFR